MLVFPSQEQARVIIFEQKDEHPGMPSMTTVTMVGVYHYDQATGRQVLECYSPTEREAYRNLLGTERFDTADVIIRINNKNITVIKNRTGQAGKIGNGKIDDFGFSDEVLIALSEALA